MMSTRPAGRPAGRLATLLLATATAAASLAVGCTGLPAEPRSSMQAVAHEAPGLPLLALRWKLITSDRQDHSKPQEFASAVVGGDKVFVGSEGGWFYALDAFTGEVRWRVKLGAVGARPTIAHGLLYVGTHDGFVVCLDTQTGAERWRYATRGAVLRAPLVVGDLVVFANEADQVYALDALKGTFKWQYKSETPDEYTLRGHAGVAIAGDLVFTGFANGSMVALRLGTGSVAWLTSLKGDADRFIDVDGTPVVVGQDVYVTSSASGVYALDTTTGLVRWRLPMDGAGGLASDGKQLFVAAADTGMHAVDFNGNVLWRQGTKGGGEPAEPVVVGPYVLYALASAGLFIANKATGEVYEYFDPGDGVSSEPTVGDDALYVLSNRGILYALDLRPL